MKNILNYIVYMIIAVLMIAFSFINYLLYIIDNEITIIPTIITGIVSIGAFILASRIEQQDED